MDNLEWLAIKIVEYHFIIKNENGGNPDIFIIIIILLIFIINIFLVFLSLESLLVNMNLMVIKRDIEYILM